MEPAEDTSLVAAIRWLVGTILGVLLMDKLDEWVRGVKLDDDVAKLKCEVERAESLVDDVRGRADGNRSLARSLARLKELLYDADDVVDELDYYRLQHQVEGVTRDEPAGMHVAERVDEIEMSSGDDAGRPKKRFVGKPRSLVWNHFTVTQEDHGKRAKAKCNYCPREYSCQSVKNGTSNMRTHMQKEHTRTWEAEAERTRTKEPTMHRPNPSSTADSPRNATPVEVGSSSSRKRKRTNEESAQTTAANTHTPWDNAELSKKIKEITSQLQGILETLNRNLEQHGSGYASSSTHHLSTSSDKQQTSSLVPGKVYGRVAEKDFIVKMITEDQSDVVTVLPIVGIAGVGKTALVQLVYSDPKVKSQFHHKIWVWVSRNFDKVRITRDMLEFVSPKTNEGSSHRNERHEGISSFAKLQEILKENMEYRGHMDDPLQKFLLILDDVWDNLDDNQWNKLLAPLIASQMKGNVILVTTRNLSVAKRLGTLNPVNLSSLADDDFWLLFKSCAYGNENYEENQGLSSIGRQIAKKLRGNPLAAETAGGLLKKDLTIDHWSNILKDEHWKSFQVCNGIMPAIKLSYDQLPYPLQKCFSYTSIFSNYPFNGEALVDIWISQGFLKKCEDSSKRLEEIGLYYLTELVNLGFFQKDEVPTNPSYSIPGVMYDFGRIVSRTDCAVIGDLQCNEIFPTVQHLSIVTGSAYIKDQYGKFPRNEKFEENLRNTVTSSSKLRTLVLDGHYDSFFLQLLQDILQKARNLRLLWIRSVNFSPLKYGVNPVHLRYLDYLGLDKELPQIWINCLHLQVLNVSNPQSPLHHSMTNLVSLRHLGVFNEVCSSIPSIGSMTSLQELHAFKVQFCSRGFEMTQLKSMNELVQLGLSQLDRVKTREEAYGARLSDKVHLEKLHLSWKDSLSDDEYTSDASSESSEELFPMDDGGPSSQPSTDTAKEVLEGLKPHMGLRHLQISGYNCTTSPTWLASNISVTSLQTLHLNDCGGYRVLPPLESLPFLTKLKLRRMHKVTEILVPSLEELVLTKMSKLETCSSTYVEHLSYSLKVLQIKNCHALKKFDLFESNGESESRQRSWLSGLRKLILRNCPQLKVSKPLPPSTTVSELLIRRVSILPSMEVSSSEKLTIGYIDEYGEESFDKSSDELTILDDKILAFHNLTNLKSMRIEGCRNLACISFKGFSHLVSLKSLEISICRQLFSSDVNVMPEHTLEDGSAANGKAFPSLQSLGIYFCGITGKWLCLLLKHAPDLEELELREDEEEEEEENGQPNRISPWEDSSSGKHGDALTGLAQDRLVHFPLNLISSLKKISIDNCPRLTFNLSKEGFSVFTSLQELTILGCPELFSSLVHKDGNDDRANGRCLVPTSLEEFVIDENYDVKALQPCFPSDLTSLRKLEVQRCRALESLQLQSCTALDELTINKCHSLTALEGLQSLSRLRHLTIVDCHSLVPKDGNDEQENGRCLLPSSLETLHIYYGWSLKTLQPCFPSDLTSLRKLEVCYCSALESLQLRSCVALEELIIDGCESLTALEGLQSLSRLRHLTILGCHPLVPKDGNDEQENVRCLLPSSLETLYIYDGWSLKTLQPCFPSDVTSLRKLEVCYCPALESLQLRSCVALEELIIDDCESLTTLEGLRGTGRCLLPTSLEEFLGSLRHLELSKCPGLPPWLESFSRQGYELCSRLETLEIDDPSVLTTSFCNHLTSLRRLKLESLVLSEEQGRALMLLKSLQQLEFIHCRDLSHLPAGPHLPSLKKLEIRSCSGISRLPETGLPLSLEEMEIKFCSKALADQFRALETSKPNVKISYLGC